MRGKVGAVVQLRAGAGITPAYAGKSLRARNRRFAQKDHPRICGEKRRASMVANCIDRITPAYAGKSISAPEKPCAVRDHPRICGEKLVCTTWLMLIMGSPPRMRGKGRAAGLDDLTHGITPAYAGKRAYPRPRHPAHRDHPRVCGEKPAAHSSGPPLTGSPPRMRGKDGPFCAHAPFLRITPAYAGKSLLPLSCSFFMRDHPRVCGEK